MARIYDGFPVTERTTREEFEKAISGYECHFDYDRAQEWRKQLKMAEMYVPMVRES